MTHIIEILKEHMAQKQSDFGDSEQVLTMLYEAYLNCDRMDDAQIKADPNGLYRNMNGIAIRDNEKGCGFRHTLRVWEIYRIIRLFSTMPRPRLQTFFRLALPRSMVYRVTSLLG